MKQLLFIPAFLAFLTPVLGESMAEEQAAACISENGANQAALESCLSKLYVPASMDCDELLEVHRSILRAADGRNNATIRAVARVSSKLAIISLSSNCYSPDVAARLVSRAGVEVGGGSGIIADATVSGAVDAAGALGVDSGTMANSASSTTTGGGGAGDGRSAGTTRTRGVEIYYDNEVIVSPSGSDS